MANIYVGMGAPNASTHTAYSAGMLVNVLGAPDVPDLADVTAVVWEVRGPTQRAVWEVDILEQTSTSIFTMRTHKTSDFPVEGHYEMRAKMTLPSGGVLHSAWSVLRVVG